MIEFTAVNWYRVPRRGWAAIVKLHRDIRGREEIRKELLGSLVVIDGEQYRVHGVKVFDHPGSYNVGERIGLLIGNNRKPTVN